MCGQPAGRCRLSSGPNARGSKPGGNDVCRSARHQACAAFSKSGRSRSPERSASRASAPAEAGPGTLTVGLRDGSAAFTLVVCAWGARLDPLWRVGVVEARRHQSRWALLFNGTHVRLLDAVRLFQRRYLEFDLDLAVDIPHTGAALWATLHRDALEERPADAPSFLARAIEWSDAHAGEVCASLRTGVLAASADVLNALMVRGGHRGVHDAFEQSLTVVYRVLFLLFAEARGLVPVWHPIYRESYSIDALRTAAEAGRSHGLWDAVRAVSRLAHAGCRAGDLKVTAFNGRLFDTRRAPLVERRQPGRRSRAADGAGADDPAGAAS